MDARNRACTRALVAALLGLGCEATTEPNISVSLEPATVSLTSGDAYTFTAVVTGASDPTVQWAVQESGGGTILQSGEYTAAANVGVYHVIARSAEDGSKSDTAAVTVVAPPMIESFVAAKSTLTSGGSTTLTATFSGGTASVSGGVGSVSLGTPISIGPLTVATTYTLTVTNALAKSVTANVTVAVVPAATITSFSASPTGIATGGSSMLTAIFANGTGVILPGNIPVTSGVAVSTGTITSTGSYTLTVKNAADDAVTAMLTVTAYAAPPVISTFAATPATITVGDSTTLSWTVSNALSLAIDQGIGAVTGSSRKHSPALSTTYTLTATNPAGTTTATVTVTVYTAPPVISSFAATPATITVGDTTTLAWTVSSAQSLAIDQGIGAVTGSSRTHVPAGSTTYTLTATNPLGSTTAQTSVTLIFAPVITSFTADPGTVPPGGSSTLSAVFTQGIGSIDQGIGSIASGTSVSTGSLTSSKTYTLSVTNAAGRIVTRSATVTVHPGAFTVTGSMSTARHFHGSVLLTDGKVLVFGGQSTANLGTAETYDPSTGVWTLTNGGMTTRGFPVGQLLSDGRVLIAGGFSASGALSSAEIYNHSTRTFSPTGPMAGPNTSFSMTLLPNGKVLVAGGYNGNTATTLGRAELYDPATGQFTSTGNLGTPRWGHKAVLLPNGKVLIVGGNGSSVTGPAPELYDPQTGSFAPTGGTTPGLLGAILLPNGKVLVAGVASHTAVLWENGATTVTGSQIALRTAPSHTLLSDGTVLVVGDSGAPGAERRAPAELYDPASATFSPTGATLTSRGQPTAHLLSSGKVLIIGGFHYSGIGVLATAELYASPNLPSVPQPAATVSAPATAAAGQTGITASVVSTSGARYVWTVSGGAITAGLGTNSVTLTAGAAGSMVVSCLVIGPLGIPASGNATINVTP